MNKTLIVVLAICLISVQAFVTPRPENDANGDDALKKQPEDSASYMDEQDKHLNPDINRDIQPICCKPLVDSYEYQQLLKRQQHPPASKV